MLSFAVHCVFPPTRKRLREGTKPLRLSLWIVLPRIALLCSFKYNTGRLLLGLEFDEEAAIDDIEIGQGDSWRTIARFYLEAVQGKVCLAFSSIADTPRFSTDAVRCK